MLIVQVFHDFEYHNFSLCEDTTKFQCNVEIQPEASLWKLLREWFYFWWKEAVPQILFTKSFLYLHLQLMTKGQLFFVFKFVKFEKQLKNVQNSRLLFWDIHLQVFPPITHGKSLKRAKNQTHWRKLYCIKNTKTVT